MGKWKWKGKKYIVILVALILVISGYVFYKIKKENFLNHQLQNIINEKTNQLYVISYDSISVDEVGGDVYIKNLHVKGDTARLLGMIKRGDTNASKMLLEVYIPLLKVVDFKTARALLAKQMECKQVIISEPQVTIYLFPGVAKPKDDKKYKEELYKQILGNFTLIKADSISVINSQVAASDFFTKEVKFRTNNTTILLSDVAIDSTYNQDTTRTLFCKEIEILSEKVIVGDKNKTAEISNVSFNTKSEVVTLAKLEYDAYKSNGFFKSTLEGISLKGISWTGALENSDLKIEEAVLEKGELETLSTKSSSSRKNPKKKSKLILTGWIKTFSLDAVQVKSLTYINKAADAEQKKIVLKNNSVVIKNLMLDRSSALNAKLLSQAKEVEISNDLISVTSKSKFYNYRLEGITLNTLAKRITAKAIKILPLLNEADFARKMKVQKDRYDIKFRNIECRKVNIEKLLEGEVYADNIILSDNSINIFHDLSYPVDSTKKGGKQDDSYPHQMFYQLDIPVKINKVLMRRTNIEYKEKNPRSQSSGRVRFSNSSVTINNVSNRLMKEGEKITVNFTSTFLDQIPVSGAFIFYADNYRKGKFMVEANIRKSFDATILNQLTQPMALAKVEKGTIHSFKFNIMADTSIAQGSLALGYENIKITLLKKKGDDYNKKDVLSILANILVKNNNKGGADMRTAELVLKPDKYRSFFNYIWKSIFSGLKQTLLKI